LSNLAIDLLKKQIRKEYFVSQNSEAVKEVFTNLELFGHYHPLILGVKKLPASSKYKLSYTIEEKPFSWIPFHIHYKAHVIEVEDSVSYIIRGIPLTKPILNYRFVKMSDDSTQVLFDLEIGGWLIGKSLLAYKMMKAQDDLFVHIAHVL